MIHSLIVAILMNTCKSKLVIFSDSQQRIGSSSLSTIPLHAKQRKITEYELHKNTISTSQISLYKTTQYKFKEDFVTLTSEHTLTSSSLGSLVFGHCHLSILFSFNQPYQPLQFSHFNRNISHRLWQIYQHLNHQISLQINSVGKFPCN